MCVCVCVCVCALCVHVCVRCVCVVYVCVPSGVRCFVGLDSLVVLESVKRTTTEINHTCLKVVLLHVPAIVIVAPVISPYRFSHRLSYVTLWSSA